MGDKRLLLPGTVSGVTALQDVIQIPVVNTCVFIMNAVRGDGLI